LWLETVPPWGQLNRNREVSGPGVEVGRERLADTVQGTSALRQRDGLIAVVILIGHGLAMRSYLYVRTANCHDTLAPICSESPELYTPVRGTCNYTLRCID